MNKANHIPLFSGGKRSEFDTMIEILEEIKGDNNVPTRIMGHVNISWNPLKSILRKLKSMELIHEYSVVTVKKDKTRRRYRITPKGTLATYHFGKVRELFEV